MIQRSRKNTILRAVIAKRLQACMRRATRPIFSADLNYDLTRHDLETAVSYARQLPDNPGNRAIRASIVAALEALNHDA